MSWVVGLAAVVVLVLLVRFIPRRLPYRRQRWLFTKAEWRFFRALVRALDGQALVMAKVRIADVLCVDGVKPATKAWWRAFGRISSKHVDYVLCAPDSGAILCAVELDDRSHQRRDRRKRDDFVNQAFAVAGIPLVRMTVQRSYDVRQLESLIMSAIVSPQYSKEGYQ